MELNDRAVSALKDMVAEGAIVSRLADAEKQRWIDGLPDYGRQWVDRNERKGLPAAEVLSALMQAVRAQGGHPARDWDRFETGE